MAPMNEQTALSDRPRPYSFLAEDYMLLDRSGAFRDYAKTELIEGVIVAVNAQFSGHARIHKRIYDALNEACRNTGLEAVFELSVQLSADSMPQPDIVVAKSLPEDGPLARENVALIVEIADATLAFDLGEKAALYARSGIPEYWVADMKGGVLHPLWAPDGDAYRERREAKFGETVEAGTLELRIDLPK